MTNKNYLIYKNKIIFADIFDEPLDKYFEIISKHNYLIFSNYNDIDFTAIINNKFIFGYNNCDNLYLQFNTSIFNQKIQFLPNNITHLKFGYRFNNFICLPDNLLFLEFGCNFNMPVDFNKNNLKHIIFGNKYNISIDIFPPNLTHLIFGCLFNKPLINLPNSLKYLKLGKVFNEKIIFPSNLTHLFMEEDFCDLLNLPEKLEYLEIFLNNLNTNTEQLLKLTNLTHLKIFGVKQENTQIILPDSLKILSYYETNGLPNILPQNLTHLILGFVYNQQIELNHNIKYVKLCGNESLSVLENLPDSVEILHLGQYFQNQMSNLPNSVKKIIFDINGYYKHELNNLPKFVELIKLPRNYSVQIKNIPSSLKTIICSKNYLFINDFISKYKIIRYN